LVGMDKKVDNLLSSFGEEPEVLFLESTHGQDEYIFKRKRLSGNREIYADVIEKCARYAGNEESKNHHHSHSNGLHVGRPWAYDDFINRLHSFREPLKWFCKDESISPVICALYGYVLHKENTLRCESCNVELVHDAVNDKQGNLLHQSLSKMHKNGCAFKETSCDDDFCHLQHRGTGGYKKAFKESVETLTNLGNRVLDSTKKSMQSLNVHFEEEKLKSTFAQEPISGLATFGWVGLEAFSVRENKCVIGCVVCGRRIDLSPFLSSSTTIDENNKAFDPKAAHRYFCPWINDPSIKKNNDAKKIIGYEECYDVIQQAGKVNVDTTSEGIDLIDTFARCKQILDYT